jgi:hydrogenase expression/formation protein HypC
MCLAVPGEIVGIDRESPGLAMGTVEFGGIRKQVCLAYVPDVSIGDYVLVHVGFAINTIDEEEAARVFEALERMGELGELDGPEPPGSAP